MAITYAIASMPTGRTCAIRCSWHSSSWRSLPAPTNSSPRSCDRRRRPSSGNASALELFPEWKGKGEKFDLAFDLSRYVLEGMAISFLTQKETERDKRVLNYLDEKLKELAGIKR